MAETIGVRVISHGERPARRVLTIEQALTWAYRDELPKARSDGSHNEGAMPAGWDAISTYARYGTEIDVSPNPYGVLHDVMALGAPHPDALRIAAAVDALAHMVLEIPDDWRPFRDFGDLGAAGEAARLRALDQVSVVAADAQGRAVRQLRAEPRRLIVRFAMLRATPDWRAERPALRYVTPAQGGKPKWFRMIRRAFEENGVKVLRDEEVDGFNESSRRPYPDAYQKTFLDPDPAEAAKWRAEWQVWVTALELLAIELEDALDTIDVRGSGRMLAPWEAPERLGRVLPDLQSPPLRPMTLARGAWADPSTVAMADPEPPKRAAKKARFGR